MQGDLGSFIMKGVFFKMDEERLEGEHTSRMRNNEECIYPEQINEGIISTSLGEYSVSVTRSSEEIYAETEGFLKLKETLGDCLREKVYSSDEPDERMLGILEQRIIYEKGLRDVGKEYGISIPRVKELELKAFQTLWLPRNQLKLKEFESSERGNF